MLRHIQPAAESAVMHLLVAIKQLLESLTLWSNLQLSESQISDVCVRFGNGFNATVAAFALFNFNVSCVVYFVIAYAATFVEYPYHVYLAATSCPCRKA